jgi:hypothetical protein
MRVTQLTRSPGDSAKPRGATTHGVSHEAASKS